jgi:hypothetical protein
MSRWPCGSSGEYAAQAWRPGRVRGCAEPGGPVPDRRPGPRHRGPAPDRQHRAAAGQSRAGLAPGDSDPGMAQRPPTGGLANRLARAFRTRHLDSRRSCPDRLDTVQQLPSAPRATNDVAGLRVVTDEPSRIRLVRAETALTTMPGGPGVQRLGRTGRNRPVAQRGPEPGSPDRDRGAASPARARWRRGRYAQAGQRKRFHQRRRPNPTSPRRRRSARGLHADT